MTTLVDIVNFNADASCLASRDWHSALSGGTQSVFHRWLELYVEHRKKISLGLIGATVADVAMLNPEAIRLINAHPEVFELLLRPFSHDIALLRTPHGFRLNVELGRSVLAHEFQALTAFFLPPEFMLTSAQLTQLHELDVRGTFINAERFKPEVKRRLPDELYMIKGLLGRRLPCIPLQGRITRAYLHSLQRWNAAEWNDALTRSTHAVTATWRDGESYLLLPDGVDRERHWLAGEDPRIVRGSVRELLHDHEFNRQPAEPLIDTYPVHSFASWVKEFRMYGYLNRVQEMERRLTELDDDQLVLWLQAINSDVLSAVEKDSPTVRILLDPTSTELVDWTIHRSQRGFEGEEYLSLLENAASGETISPFFAEDPSPHMQKIRTRIAYWKRRRLRP